MNRNLMIGVGVGLLGGFILGYFTGSVRASSEERPVMAATVPARAVSPGMMPSSGVTPSTVAVQARVMSNLQIVAREPGNLEAWRQLGNDYFDTNQPQQAVDAYAKALALKPGDPDILTDQGIMFRQLKAYDRAVANFEKASRLDPQHMQSRFNLGIVYAQDLQQKDKAIKVWKRIIEVAPASSQAAQARAAIAELGAQ